MSEVVLTLGIGLCAAGAFLICVGVLCLAIAYSYVRNARTRLPCTQKVASSCNRLLDPPTCSWQPKRGMYAAFISHCKDEAGSDARYLRDLLERMLGGTPCFLDSANLADLRNLLSEGLRRADVVLLLGTTSVFTRPWVLIELFEAAQHHVPVVILTVKGAMPLDESSARATITNLEMELQRVNPDGLTEVRRHVGHDLSRLKAALLSLFPLPSPSSLVDAEVASRLTPQRVRTSRGRTPPSRQLRSTFSASACSGAATSPSSNSAAATPTTPACRAPIWSSRAREVAMSEPRASRPMVQEPSAMAVRRTPTRAVTIARAIRNGEEADMADIAAPATAAVSVPSTDVQLQRWSRRISSVGAARGMRTRRSVGDDSHGGANVAPMVPLSDTRRSELPQPHGAHPLSTLRFSHVTSLASRISAATSQALSRVTERATGASAATSHPGTVEHDAVLEGRSSLHRTLHLDSVARGAASGTSHLLEWHPHASDNQILADAVDLVQRMHTVTGRGPVGWHPRPSNPMPPPAYRRCRISSSAPKGLGRAKLGVRFNPVPIMPSAGSTQRPSLCAPIPAAAHAATDDACTASSSSPPSSDDHAKQAALSVQSPRPSLVGGSFPKHPPPPLPGCGGGGSGATPVRASPRGERPALLSQTLASRGRASTVALASGMAALLRTRASAAEGCAARSLHAELDDSQGRRTAAVTDATDGTEAADGTDAADRTDAADDFAVFISCDAREAAGDARYWQAELFKRFGRRPCYVDTTEPPDDPEAAHALALERVRLVGRSEAFVLLQTANVLTRPHVLLELHEAVRRNKPMALVLLEGRGYSFAEAKDLLTHLPSALEQRRAGALPALQRLLGARGIDLDELQRALLSAVPNFISVRFNSARTETHALAAVEDVTDRLMAHPHRTLDRMIALPSPRARPTSHGVKRAGTVPLPLPV